MLKIYYNNTTPVYLRPTPLVSISHSPNKNKMGTLGCTYSITLNGTIVSHAGSPIFAETNIASDALSYDVNLRGSNHYNPDTGERLTSIIKKQNSIRNLFSKDGQKIEIKSLDESKTAIVFYPNVVSINFEEGPYIETCKYSIALEAPLLFDASGNVYTEGLIGSTFSPNKFSLQRSKDDYLRETASYNTTSLDNIISRWGGLVEEFTDTWSIETDESNAQSTGLTNIPVSYRVTRNVSATGKNVYSFGTRKPAWEHALGFIKKTVLEEPDAAPNGVGYSYADSPSKLEQYPGFRISENRSDGKYSSGMLNLPSYYRGYNHVRSININKTDGSCSFTDTWLLASGQSHIENYTLSLDSSAGNAFTNVKIEGNIKGLSDIHASGYNSVTFNNVTNINKLPYYKALKHYFDVSNSGKFGIGSVLFKRANNFSNPIVLNSQPLSVSLATNEIAGEINYSLEFDDRPYNYFSGILGENISVNDTYPGDVFAVIPVIGRKTGPILQYITGRTEYNRNINIELLLDYTDLAYSSGRQILLYKPVLDSNIQLSLKTLIDELSPKNEPNVTKYFLNPPTETWSPKEGRYTLNLNWVYEKSI